MKRTLKDVGRIYDSFPLSWVILVHSTSSHCFFFLHLWLGLASSLFLSRSLTKILYILLVFPVPATLFMKLTTHLHLVPRLRMCESVPPLLHFHGMVLDEGQGQLYLLPLPIPPAWCYPPSFDHPNNIWWVQIMKLLIVVIKFKCIHYLKLDVYQINWFSHAKRSSENQLARRTYN